jgi:hypothetical protein
VNEGRTKMLLGILGVLLLIVVWHFLGPVLGMGGGDAGGDDDYANLTTSVGRIPGAGRASSASPEVEEVADLRVDELQGTHRGYRPGRDPWRFVDPPPPPTPPPPPPPSREQVEAQDAEAERLRRLQEEAARLAAIEAARPKPPQFTLKYMGKFGPANRPIAVFTDGKNIFNVQKGEVIQGEFIVGQIGFESVEIQFVKFPNEPPQRLPVGR